MEMELVSELGRQSVVKIYSGEALTFKAREKNEGLSGLFSSSEYLYEVTFVLKRWPKVRQDAAGMIKGANRPVVREQKPGKQLWGDPPPSITVECGEPGRYQLIASKPGYAPVEVVIHMASFRIDDIDGELDDDHYRASFTVELSDPDEKRTAISLLVESLDMDGRIVDLRKDVVLAPVALDLDDYRSSRRIIIASNVLEPFMDRMKRNQDDPVPAEFLDRGALRIVEGGMLRISFRSLQAVYPIPLGYS
jgi:hypothetical protein